jgi:predicted transcriptional regulator
MTDKTITLQADIVEQLESLAQSQGRTVDDVIGEMLAHYVPYRSENWALTLAEGMEEADIDWLDEPDASARSGEHYARHMTERWAKRQSTDTKDA